ncbi:hypothetical protein BCR33DRAFT_725441 [Rhizoclosmatium globosum]|uniref:Uncharacterized protein n=1 Tax=Rhizoclosmatium globosum TaxID=329046 RepID=A0A1Y2AZ96_9FUNG|nr:hypothetical protein BCR33DRAFT_725441 [Rhizoclosmatium globosum]|eukprot:ORY27557.1 hypothetical protein BCR33DRAFT_725441 [Rhizoclosmatium globosum]
MASKSNQLQWIGDRKCEDVRRSGSHDIIMCDVINDVDMRKLINTCGSRSGGIDYWEGAVAQNKYI